MPTRRRRSGVSTVERDIAAATAAVSTSRSTSGRTVLIVEYDVTGLDDGQVDSLISAATAQSESDGYYPDVSVAHRVERRLRTT